MAYGAGYVAAKNNGAIIVDPRPYLTGTMKNVFEEFPQITEIVPAMGYNDRPPKTEELEKMKALVAESVNGGALGISTGLEYAPGSFATPEEVTELCRVAVETGGMYSSHMRDEGDFLIEALDETIEIARQAGANLQISHFKIAYRRSGHKIYRFPLF